MTIFDSIKFPVPENFFRGGGHSWNEFPKEIFDEFWTEWQRTHEAGRDIILSSEIDAATNLLIKIIFESTRL